MSTLVEARSKKEALQLAAEVPVKRLCHQCSGGNAATEWVTSGEIDGEPTPTRVEVEEP